jgi:hypothetical protein
MRRDLIALLIFLNAFVLSHAVNAQTAGQDEQAIRTIIAATTDAFSRHDAKAWRRLSQHDRASAEVVNAPR